MRHFIVALVGLCAIACTQPAASPSPTVVAVTPTASSTAPAPTATVGAASPSPSALPRIQVSDAALTAIAGRWVLFQLPGDPRLRAISIDAQQSGVLPVQLPAQTYWTQSAYGSTYMIGKTLYGLDGRAIGDVPWTPDEVSFTWSNDARFFCAAVPDRRVNGSPLRLETAFAGQAPRVVARGFGSWGDNSGHRVLACDETTDRAIVAVFGQGLYAGRLWVFKLSNGQIVRSIDYPNIVGRWVAASQDATLIAETEQLTFAGPKKVTVRAADDGAILATLDNAIVQGFSGDNALVVVSETAGAAVIEWKTGRRIWSATGTYGGFIAEPSGRRFAVGIGFVGGSDQRDVYLVAPDGTAKLLPSGVKFSPSY
jgi:hypothetical protein